MTIKKFLHSCILIENEGRRLLIDPGAFSFIEGKLKPEEIGAVDGILITHSHADHCYPKALKKILSLKPAPIIAHQEIIDLLAKEKISAEPIAAGEIREVAGFSVQAFKAPHEPILTDIPHNLAFFINKTLLHPGDSLSVNPLPSCEILALPVASPWARRVDAVTFTQQVNAKTVIPIHDAFLKDFF